ncbi:MAG: DUF123 domain-containing protein [Magnetospiraceae bacterium]
MRIPTLDQFPPRPGAYILGLRLTVPLVPGVPPGAGLSLMPGWYAYCGSAQGPGGLRARLRRHARWGKKVHWHVDRVTQITGVSWALAQVNGDEHQLLAVLTDFPGVRVPIPRFGASDCRTCPAHLVALPPGLGAAQIVTQVSADAEDIYIWKDTTQP